MEDDSLKFLSPIWLWGLLLIPIFYFLIFRDEQRKQSQFESFAQRGLWPLISPELDFSCRLKKARIWLLAWSFLLLALAQPMYGSHEDTVQVAGLDVVINLDVSNSMLAEDVVPSRLQKAKHLIRSLLSGLEGDRVGLVAFAASTYVACPLTTDLSYVWDTVETLNPKMIQNQGTDLGAGIETALKAIERGSQERVSASPNIASSNIVILITDGEDLEGHAMDLASQIRESGVRLYILGVGTQKGAPIPIQNEAGNTVGFKRDEAGKVVMSEFHPDSLAQLAKASGGKYWDVTDGEGEVEEILREAGALNRSDYTERRYRVYDERFQIPLFFAIILFLIEISMPARKILALLVLMFGFLGNHEVLAADPFKKPAPLDAYLENKKGIQAFQEGRMEDAQKSFGEAQARDPSLPELEFNQGLVQLQQGESDHAVESFQNSARFAESRGNQDLIAKSKYNLGQAFLKKGDVKNSIQSYAEAIEAAQKSKNLKLELEARKNLQLSIQEIKKQEKKQQEEKKEEEKKQEPKKENQSQSDQKSQKGQKNQNEEKMFQKPQQGKFKSQKMTQDDVDRVMSELTGKEKQLQEKLQVHHGKNQNNPKDW